MEPLPSDTVLVADGDASLVAEIAQAFAGLDVIHAASPEQAETLQP